MFGEKPRPLTAAERLLAAELLRALAVAQRDIKTLVEVGVSYERLSLVRDGLFGGYQLAADWQLGRIKPSEPHACRPREPLVTPPPASPKAVTRRRALPAPQPNGCKTTIAGGRPAMKLLPSPEMLPGMAFEGELLEDL